MPSLKDIITRLSGKPSPEDLAKSSPTKHPEEQINTLKILYTPIGVTVESVKFSLAPPQLRARANSAVVMGKAVTSVEKLFPLRQETNWSAFLLPEARKVRLATELEEIILEPLKDNAKTQEGKLAILINGHSDAIKRPWQELVNDRIGETDLVLDFIPPLIASALKQVMENGGKVGIATMSEKAPGLMQIATVTTRTIGILQRESSPQRAAQKIFAKSRQAEVLQITPAQNRAITFSPIKRPALISPGNTLFGKEIIKPIVTIPDKVPFTTTEADRREPLLVATQYPALGTVLPTQYHNLSFMGSVEIRRDPANFFPRAYFEGEGSNARIKLILPEWSILLSGVDLSSGKAPPDLASRISQLITWLGPAIVSPLETKIETAIAQKSPIPDNQLFALIQEIAENTDITTLVKNNKVARDLLYLLGVSVTINTNPDMTEKSAGMVQKVATANALRVKGVDKGDSPQIMVNLD